MGIKLSAKEIKAIIFILTLICSIIIGTWPVVVVFCITAAVIMNDESLAKSHADSLTMLAKNQTNIVNTLELVSEDVASLKNDRAEVEKIAKETKDLLNQAKLQTAFKR